MPLGAPFALMLWKVRPPAPMVVFWTLSAEPVVVVSVLLAPVAVTVPPPLAEKAGLVPVSSVIWPVKLIVPPVLADRVTPPPASLVSAIAPLMMTVPPERAVISTAVRPDPLLIAPA